MGVTSGIVNSVIDGEIAVLGYATGVAVVGVFFAACRAGPAHTNRGRRRPRSHALHGEPARLRSDSVVA
jgi:hypothetical protein